MFILDVSSTCNNAALALTLSAFKRIILLIQIIVPILLIIGAGIGIFQMVQDPERKNGTKSIINKFIAAAMVFFIPVFINAVMGMVGESTNFSSCWNSSSYGGGTPSSYVDPYDQGDKNNFIPNSGDYEKGKKKVVPSSNSNSNSSSGNTSHAQAGNDSPVATTTSNANKVIFLGDSRTVQMKNHLNSYWKKTNTSGANDVFVSKGGMGLNWMQSTGIPEAKRYFGSGSALVILMGVNDLRNINSYISYLRDNASSWTSTGTRVYFVSVNPCDGSYSHMNSRIESFNSTLSSSLPSGVSWIDTHSYLMSTGYTTTDGLHYNSNTSYKIYNYIKSKV